MTYRIAIVILIMGILSGCKTREYKARNYYLDNKPKLAELANMVFPPRAEYKTGMEVKLKPDTMYRSADTVYVQGDCPDGTTIKVPCPPCDTVVVYVPVMRVDTAFIPDDRGKEVVKEEAKVKGEENIGLKVELRLEKQRSRNRLIWGIVSTLLLAGVLAWRVWGSKVTGIGWIEKIKRLF